MTEEAKRGRRAAKTEADQAPAEEAPKPAAKATPATAKVKSDLVFKRRLAQGDHGPSVAEIQRIMTAKGYFEGRQDGRYGTLLAKAVRRFQGDQGLKVNGEVDIRTWEAMTA